MSYFPAISEVQNIHPDDTEGDKPPTTDADKDGIPDVHENLFEEWVNWTTSDGRDVFQEGMDKLDATDAFVDNDRDGLNATEEYCWPYPANCTEPGFPRGLTGILDEDGERVYLDPRVSDTDGDGLPDGYEAYMCARIGGYDSTTLRYECARFDPLNASDATDDYDEDGFDVNRDGIMSVSERFTSPEEYSYGTSSNHTTELDGLWCSATLPEGSIIKQWPYLPSGDNATFHNILAACTTNSTSSHGEDLWLGTDPLLDDSDLYHWDGYSVRPLFPTFGDGIPDGWEVHFGLDPINRTNALIDFDKDGWDKNRDGIITDDVSRTISALKIGEALSTLEEYYVHYDDGNMVSPGLKSVFLGSQEDTFEHYPLIFDQQNSDIEMVHYDIQGLHSNAGFLYAPTKYGVTTIDTVAMTSTHQSLPHGIEVTDSILLVGDGDAYALAMTTNQGLAVAPLQVDGQLAQLTDWDFEFTDSLNSLVQLQVTGQNSQVLALGDHGVGSVFEIETNSNVLANHQLSSSIETALDEANASVTSLAHGSPSGGNLTLFIGTDVGLYITETSTARSTSEGDWRFFYSTDKSVTVDTSLDEVRPLSLGTIANPAEVRDLTLDGPSSSNSQVLWIATPSGVHQLDFADDRISHSGLLEHPGFDGKSISEANDVHSIYPTGDEIIIGSAMGIWVIAGDYATVYGVMDQENTPGEISEIILIDVDGNDTLFTASSPGQYANLELIHPKANDSDNDGMPDGWEVVHGLDPTDPWDALLDSDGDGIDVTQDGDGFLDRLWTNLDEYRYVAITEDGFNSTTPSEGDTDGDGLPDGAEFFGFFFEQSNLWCHYDAQMNYICDDAAGQAANATYLSMQSSDSSTDASNWDSDGDGMPDGWEIEHRRWIGSTFSGGNNWSLDPMRADDANWDADGDGLPNLCEYKWSLVKEAAMFGLLLETHGESAEAAAEWSIADPNNIDSDGDSLPDGWESKGSCIWDPSRIGINPLNSSDILNNPDGDGYDVNHDGILSLDEQFVNWLEFHIRSDLFDGSETLDGEPLPEGLTTSIFANIAEYGDPEDTFAGRASGAVLATQLPTSAGSADPLNADSDDDGMPDGWEIWHARWDQLDDEWTLNPLNGVDRWQDADEDGMTNWEEYNSISREFSETNENRTSPQWFVTTIGSAYSIQQWPGITSTQSFGAFLSPEQYNISVYTSDTNKVDTDGDGVLDGVELLFTSWNLSAQTWTLNPLVAGDGDFDSDSDGLSDRQEFALAISNPDNGADHPVDAPLLHIDGDLQQPTEKAQRVFNILLSKETRGKRLLSDFNAWQSGEPANAFISMLMGMTDPTIADTDEDGMYDGFEYWFTEWDLEENRWSMNPLIDSDVYLDTDGDSFDCNGDGYISTNETFNNLREWESRTWGKFNARSRVPTSLGIVNFGQDAINAYMEEMSFSQYQAKLALYNDFISKDQESYDRMLKINEADSENFNRTLMGVADPTHSDSDNDGIPDGWEYCYATYGLPNPTTQNHWASNPINPWDINYDGDNDGWYDRISFDVPAEQGTWDARTFTPSGQIIQTGIGDLPFTNWMEYDNQTRPDLNDSDGDSVTFNTEVSNGQVTSHTRDYNLSDGREVFKYGTNPSDNDTDGDMLPDWYEYKKAWNETNDNYSSFLQVQVRWVDAATGSECDTSTTSCLPLSISSNGTLGRPDLDWTWFTLDPRDPVDANYDPDMDGNWDCSGAGCVYTPYTNFQEFYAITDSNLASPNAVRLAPLIYQGQSISEWWQFRGHTLHLGEFDEGTSNYLKMWKDSSLDFRYAYVVDDRDENYLIQDSSDDIILLAGNRTDQWEIYYAGSPNTAPVPTVGEHELGWYYLDLDDDHLAEGTDPLNWDTDGDWLVDAFEVRDDETDGLRGDSSPIRYDSRQTG